MKTLFYTLAFVSFFSITCYALEQENLTPQTSVSRPRKLTFEEKIELYKKSLPPAELARLKESYAQIIKAEEQEELERRRANQARLQRAFLGESK